VIAPTDDARTAFERDDAKLLAARAEISTARKCLARQREIYAQQKEQR
jgi:hypothetical protein